MSRHYKHNGLELPSVTTIISDCTNSSGALTQWAANMVVAYMKEHLSDDSSCPYECSEILEKLDKARFNFHKVSQKALDIGSEVHNAIEMHLQGLPYTLTTKEAKNGFQAFIEWAETAHLKPIALEQKVYGNGWAGTLDFNGYYQGKRYVIDWKTSKRFYPEMRYQVAIYRSAIEDSEGCGVLRLDKETGMPEFKDTSKSYEQDKKIFLKMLDLYMERHPRIKKKAYK
jgi:hypothetical protein